MPAFRIKICGITSPDDALLAARAGADALGLNFFPPSPRFVRSDIAREIVGVLSGKPVLKVGLFVNHPPEAVLRIYDDLALDLIQLHGDEPPEYLRRLGTRPVMRALRVGPAGLGPVIEYLAQCARLRAMPELVLLDTDAGKSYGGSGQTGDWSVLAEYPRQELPPVVLAGGLNPGNVAEAIRAVRPAAVDVASGVESSPGRKSAELVIQFVALARAALEEV